MSTFPSSSSLIPNFRLNSSAHPSYTMSGLCIVGGIAGYAKSRSFPSLLSGLALSIVFTYSGLQIQNGDYEKGHTTGLIGSSILGAGMTVRFIRTRKIFPAGVFGVLGLLSTAYHAQVLKNL